MAVEVDVLVTGTAQMPERYVFRPDDANRLTPLSVIVLGRGGRQIEAPCLAYAVRHPDAGTILIDTGFHPDAAQSPRKDFGLAMGLLFRRLRVTAPFSQQLAELGIDAADVKRVVMTHLHVDHTSAMRLLPNATFLCAREEWAQATAPRAGANGFIAGHLPPRERMELVDFARQGEPHGPFAATVDLLGDGSIRLLSTPGHTAGHMSVLLGLADGAQVLVVGDAAYTLRSIREQRLSLLTHDDDAYRRSLAQLKAFTEQEPDAVVVPTHDSDAWRQLAG
jgi:N-acyl homoserine lactone hydrolase